jgi:uncharacterized repeat protein (TIGR02543 family)
VTFGSTYGTLATTSRTGYTFDGWFTAASGGTAVDATISVTTAADHTLYAQWTALPNHTVIFDGNGATGGSMSNQEANVPTTLTPNTFTLDGYSFSGWNTQVNGSGTPYADEAVYSFAEDLTLYAQWSALTSLAVTPALTQANINTGSNSSTATGDGDQTAPVESITVTIPMAQPTAMPAEPSDQMAPVESITLTIPMAKPTAMPAEPSDQMAPVESITLTIPLAQPTAMPTAPSSSDQTAPVESGSPNTVIEQPPMPKGTDDGMVSGDNNALSIPIAQQPGVSPAETGTSTAPNEPTIVSAGGGRTVTNAGAVVSWKFGGNDYESSSNALVLSSLQQLFLPLIRRN